MTVEDDLSEEQQRKMAAKLLMGVNPRTVQVVTRRSGRPKPDPLELRFVECVDRHDGEWVYCQVEQKASSGWVKFEKFDEMKEARRAAEKYGRLGDKVSWAVREI